MSVKETIEREIKKLRAEKLPYDRDTRDDFWRRAGQLEGLNYALEVIILEEGWRS